MTGVATYLSLTGKHRDSGFPSEWEMLELGRIATPRLGGNYRNSGQPSRRPLIKMGNIARVGIDLSRLEYIPDSEEVDPTHRLQFGDVLFNTRNTLDLVGKVSIWRNELPIAYFNSNILRLEFNAEYCGDSQYFGYALNSNESIKAIRSLATGTTSVAAVYTRDLLKLRIPVPPPKEQVAIAEALSDVDDLIDALDQLIQKKQMIRLGVGHALISGRRRLPNHDADWATGRLSGFGTTYGGLSGKKAADFGTGESRFVPFLNVVTNVRTNPDDLVPVVVGQGEQQNTIKTGDVLLNGSSETPEEVALASYVEDLPSNTYLNSFCFGFRPNSRTSLDPLFLAYLLRSSVGRSLMGPLAQGSTRFNISKSAFLGLEIPLPPVQEQRAIAEILSKMDDEIDALVAQRDKTDMVKKAMMGELLTGKTRLV